VAKAEISYTKRLCLGVNRPVINGLRLFAVCYAYNLTGIIVLVFIYTTMTKKRETF
jgi:hypothetical protein